MKDFMDDKGILVSISIVSHGQINLIEKLLRDISVSCKNIAIEIILTLNLNEVLLFSENLFSFPIKVIRNFIPLGFSANHNQAFGYAKGKFFCVVNPDIRFDENPFLVLIDCLKNISVGVAAPVVLDQHGKIEDSARRFPTPFKIICKAFGKCKESDYLINEESIYPDWAGGMFLLFPRSIFEILGGFDRRYFLYYEDVDICARLKLLGYVVVVSPLANVTHHAQRSSHHNIRYLYWHLCSMMRFFLSPVFWRVQSHKFISKSEI